MIYGRPYEPCDHCQPCDNCGHTTCPDTQPTPCTHATLCDHCWPNACDTCWNTCEENTL